MKHSTGNRTKAEQARFDKMKEMGLCMACYQDGVRGSQYVDIHHFLSGNKRIGHMATVALCPWHHDAKWDNEAMTQSDMLADFGPSFHKHRREFRVVFGSDEELLAMQNALLDGTYDP
jgi:hypothetical protein